jgi:hypothetical protein
MLQEEQETRCRQICEVCKTLEAKISDHDVLKRRAGQKGLDMLLKLFFGHDAEGTLRQLNHSLLRDRLLELAGAINTACAIAGDRCVKWSVKYICEDGG